MNASHMRISLFLLCLLSFTLEVHSQLSPDALSMKALKASLGNPEYKGWSNQDPCKWTYITCWNNQITKIQLSNLNLTGSLPPDLRNLSSLVDLEVANNQLIGPIPSLAGLSSLQNVLLNNNFFSYIPSDFFKGLTSLRSISFDHNPFSSWEIPESLKDATYLQSFSANAANISGTIPDFLGGDTFPQLVYLQLAVNNLQGQIPSSFSKSSIQILRLNDQNRNSSLNGSVAVLQNMTSLTQVWLQVNRFTGPLPDLSRLIHLKCLSLSDNQLTGIVPLSLVSISTLTTVYLKNNWLQGPTPEFHNSKVVTDVVQGRNSFCLDDPGVVCNSRVNNLLSIAQSVGYPVLFAQSWKGNDPCNTSLEWKGIICDEGNIVMINFENLTLSGTISPNFSLIKSLEVLILSGNTLTGTIPKELTNLPNLRLLDVSYNHLHGKVPNFRTNVAVTTDGNPDIEPYGVPPMSSPGKSPSSDHGHGKSSADGQSKTTNTRKIVGYVTSAVCGLLVIVGFGVFLYTRKRKHCRYWKHLRNSTNNFDQKNILGTGGYGTVYKGELPDGTKIAVKRMKSGVVTEQGLTEFKSEIDVLTKVRHCHLVALLGSCLDGNEGLLVYEYMPQGNLSRHLFNWKEEGLKPLEWTRRLTIALDVARGLEYLHGLAHQSFIHRDLKPSNILLGDDMKAKVADFGLARLVPGKGGHSIETRLVGTPGYIAPEYIVTGRVTTKVDVFSFGVILMELITGKKAIGPTLPEDMVHLIPWFRRMHTVKHTFPMAIDQTIELDEKTLASVSTVAELADHCCTGEPHQRPEMNHAVNVLSSLVELWRPVQPFYDDIYGISLDRSSS